MVVMKYAFLGFFENDAQLRARHRRNNGRDMSDKRSTMLAICSRRIDLLLDNEFLFPSSTNLVRAYFHFIEDNLFPGPLRSFDINSRRAL